MRKLLAPCLVACLALVVSACSSGRVDDTPTAAATSLPRTATSAPVTPSPSPTATAATIPAGTTAATATSIPSPAGPTPAATSASGQPSATAAAAPSPAESSPVTLTVHAHDLLFDVAELHARAGQQVTAVFVNEDEGVSHNLGFSLPGLAHGETCAGPCTLTQTFTAGAPGSYAFFCTIHATMFGTFVVDP